VRRSLPTHGIGASKPRQPSNTASNLRRDGGDTAWSSRKPSEVRESSTRDGNDSGLAQLDHGKADWERVDSDHRAVGEPSSQETFCSN
jgi:hypothetical protein